MIATIVNSLSIIVGTIIGLLISKNMSSKAKDVVFNSCGMISIVIGMSLAIKTDFIVGMAASLILGGLWGEKADLEGKVLLLGEKIKKLVSKKDNKSGDSKDNTDIPETKNFAYAFLNSSVLFCVGAMAIVGSFKAGAEGDYSLIFTKSILDGFVAIMFASSMGIGVGFSALSIFVYQGILTVLASFIKPYVSPEMITEVSAVGGAIVIMIGLGLMEIKKLRTGNFLPAMLIVIVLVLLKNFVGTLGIF